MQNTAEAHAEMSAIPEPNMHTWRLDLAASGEALGPLDGRYRRYAAPLINYLSEAALNRSRVYVEVEWLIFIVDSGFIPQLAPLTQAQRDYLRDLYRNFGTEQIAALKQYEQETRHDVKAVEYLIGDYLRAAEAAGVGDMSGLVQAVHFLFTSEDVNNLAQALNVREAVRQVWLPAANELLALLNADAQEYRALPMLALTHGQPATPTTLGKEFAVFAYRLLRQLRKVAQFEFLGKCNGATGNWAAHYVALPAVDWPAVTSEFIRSLGLVPNIATTQIESHDWQVDLYGLIDHADRIVHNFATDMWFYISRGYLVQDLAAQGSTGSSTMPHKVNPIRFENAEANLEVASGMFATLQATLATSRLQRDLTDSSMQRSVANAFGHSLLALHNITAGLRGVKASPERLDADLEDNWIVLSEAIQQVMRVRALQGDAAMGDPYARLKEATRGRGMDRAGVREFIRGLGLPQEETERLLSLTPQNYYGDSEGVVARVSAQVQDYLASEAKH